MRSKIRFDGREAKERHVDQVWQWAFRPISAGKFRSVIIYNHDSDNTLARRGTMGSTKLSQVEFSHHGTR
jgi:hypothetical protein